MRNKNENASIQFEQQNKDLVILSEEEVLQDSSKAQKEYLKLAEKFSDISKFYAKRRSVASESKIWDKLSNIQKFDEYIKAQRFLPDYVYKEYNYVKADQRDETAILVTSGYGLGEQSQFVHAVDRLMNGKIKTDGYNGKHAGEYYVKISFNTDEFNKALDSLRPKMPVVQR